MKRVGSSFLVFVFLFCIWVLPVMAADPPAEIEQLKGDVQKLLDRIQELEKKQAETATKAVETEKKVESVEKLTTKIKEEEAQLQEDKKKRAIAYYRDGFFIETPDKQFRLQIGGVLHFDTRVFAGGTKTPSSFDIRRARYDMRGNLYKGAIEHVFRLQLEMADPIALRNAYWMFKFRPEFNLQLGQFKVPSGGADWLTEEAHVNFIEYATERPVAPDFDRGFNIHSFFLDGMIQTNLAMVTGTGYDVDNRDGDWDSDKNYVGRIMLIPFKKMDNKWLKGIHLAGSYETGQQSIKTTRGERDMSTENYESRWFQWKATTADIGSRTRYGGELHWIAGPFAASYEFNRVEWEDITLPTPITGVSSLPGRSHVDVQQFWVSYFLTGEEKTIEDVFFAWRQPKPKKNFSLKDGTWGAWEVLARYSYKDASKELFDKGILDGSQKGYSVTGGLRWIWNPKVRIMLDVNYLKSDEGKGIITNYAAKGVSTNKDYQKDETGFLLRLILTP
jgi:phosphate-selective porin OprO/OprP